MARKSDPVSTQPGQVLVVDDDELVVQSLTMFLEAHGWTVLTAYTGRDALKTMQRLDIDAVLLDVNLPDISGFDVLGSSQDEGFLAPVIMISTSTDDSNRLHALGLGAQDYLTKPLNPETLIDRLATFVPRKEGMVARGQYRFGDVLVDINKSLVYRPGAEPESIPNIHRELLRTLLAHPGEVISRRRLLIEALGLNPTTVASGYTIRALDTKLNEQIDEIREFIEPDPKQPFYLKKIFGQGYRLENV